MITDMDNDFDKTQEDKISGLSPFEIKNELINLANLRVKNSTITLLNAGRGNPNWVATEAREAFFTLGQFGISECRLVYNSEAGIAGIPCQKDISKRFEKFLTDNTTLPGIDLLKRTYEYMKSKSDCDPDELVHEWAEGVIGDQYPIPDRILKYTEIICREYITKEMCGSGYDPNEFDLFATEGSTAGMCYVFDSLARNFVINQNDSVAILVPVFSPYIEIPKLECYNYDVTYIYADTKDEDGLHTWQYEPSDIEKLRDPKYKAVYVINPSNPPSYEMNRDCVNALVDVVKNYNKNLIIITDDVYGTYVPGFRSLISDLPFNTICLYSFSKYFGATGWRIAAIMMNKNNLIDKIISELPQDKIDRLNTRYEFLSTQVDTLRFIERLVADSRLVALNHTAGLSLPQQIQMTLFAASSLLDKEDKYRIRMLEIINGRLTNLWKSIGFTLKPDPLRAGYYSEIDLIIWGKKLYGQDFVDYFTSNYNPVDITIRLARETGLVVLNGGGFDGPRWSIRVSLANLINDDYINIGQNIIKIFDEYVDSWKASKQTKS